VRGGARRTISASRNREMTDELDELRAVAEQYLKRESLDSDSKYAIQRAIRYLDPEKIDPGRVAKFDDYRLDLAFDCIHNALCGLQNGLEYLALSLRDRDYDVRDGRDFPSLEEWEQQQESKS
jgi:hypothetical protein